jgi:hypothetical protein
MRDRRIWTSRDADSSSANLSSLKLISSASAEPLEWDRGRAIMQNRFWLQKVADGSTGERFIIKLEADAKPADCSKPLSASDARLALHKLGNSDAAIASMFERARSTGQSGETGLSAPTQRR